MVRTALGRIVLATLVASLGLVACSSSGPQSPDGTARPPSAKPSATPAAAAPAELSFSRSTVPGCRHRYETWEHGSAIVAFSTKLDYVLSAKGSDDITSLTADLKKAGSAAASLPLPPHCADPAHYYSQILAKIQFISTSARPAKGLGALLMAEAPLRSVKVIESQLRAEVSQTVGTRA